MGSQLKSFLHCTGNSKCVHYGNYSSCNQENWLEKGKDDHQPFCLENHLNVDTIPWKVTEESTVLVVKWEGNITSSHVNVLTSGYFRRPNKEREKKKTKKKPNGRYVFEIHAHKSGFITQRNGWAFPGKVYRPFFGRRELRTKFRRTLKLERIKKSIKQINKKQPKR